MKLHDIVENQHLIREPQFPEHVMLKDGFYMQRGSTNDRSIKWFVHLLLDDDIYAIIHMNPSFLTWIYVPLKPEGADELQMNPKSIDFFNLDKFKDFAIECLIHEKWLPQPT